MGQTHARFDVLSALVRAAVEERLVHPGEQGGVDGPTLACIEKT